MKKLSVLLTFAFLAVGSFAFAQDVATDDHLVTISVDEVFIMDIEPAASKDISLSLTQPDEAGNTLDADSNSTLWVNYTSVVDVANSETRSITAQTDAATPGFVLSVEAGAGAGNGGGSEGTPVSGGAVTLTNASASIIIESIGSAYTGTGANNGHNLTYRLSAASGANFGSLDHTSSQDVTVTYTITNN